MCVSSNRYGFILKGADADVLKGFYRQIDVCAEIEQLSKWFVSIGKCIENFGCVKL